MCGIAGYLPSDGEKPDRALLTRMCDRLVHRGPDACGYYCDHHAALGHRRLSIIDLAGGNQPLGNEDGSLQVVFNGEIYNFRSLRRDLVSRGHVFSTASDTEVLVHLYEEEGERMPAFLNGMFAFVLWDRTHQELFAARDRLGKKPLYYSFDVAGTRFCFASELKALLALPGFEPEVSARAVADFLAFSYVPDPQTIYESVRKLEPGSSLTVTRHGHRLRKYWRPKFEPSLVRSPGDAAEEIRQLAVDAVKSRLISEVPLGTFLSGGVDSSAVAGIIASETPERPRTFSIGFSSEPFDERPFARMVAERYGTEHSEEVVSQSVHAALAALSKHFDEPFGDSSAVPTLSLARMTKRHVTVALGGDGADELFGGYRRYRFGVIEQKLRAIWPKWFRQSVIRAGAACYPKFDYLPQVFRAKTLLQNLSVETGDAYFTSMSVFRDEGLSAILSNETRRDLGGYSPRDDFRARFDRVRELPPLEQMQAVDFETYLPGDILVKLDRATMAHSLEARSPWLDYRLVELACRLPTEYKLHGASGKFVFKQAVAPFVPPALLKRRKMGFSPPLAVWLRDGLSSTFEEVVQRPEMEAYICRDEAKRLWDEHRSGLHNHDRKLWNLLILALWDRERRHSAASEFAEAAV